MTLLAGDFFVAVPAGADLYLLKSVLHNWDDARATSLLERCAAALGGRARLVIVERLLPARLRDCPEDLTVTRQDLQMLLGPGGRERRLDDYRVLASGAGLRIARHWPLAFGLHALEVERS